MKVKQVEGAAGKKINVFIYLISFDIFSFEAQYVSPSRHFLGDIF